MYISIVLKWNMKIMTVFYIIFIYDANFFDFLKALPMKKIFQEHETNVDFYSLFDHFQKNISCENLVKNFSLSDTDNFDFVSLLGFPENFHFQVGLFCNNYKYSKVDEPGVKKFSYPGIVFKLVKIFFTFKIIFTFSR